MRHLQIALFVVLLPLLVLSLALSGCKKPEETYIDDEGGGSSGGDKTVQMTGIKMGKGVVKGKVVLTGATPDLAAMSAALRIQIEGKADKKECLAGKPEEIAQQAYQIGPDKKVGNVFVWVMPVDTRASFFEFSTSDIESLKLKPVVTIDQPHCAFLPHVDMAFTGYVDPANPKKKTLPTGQIFDVYNGATIAHNTKWPQAGKITSGNVQLPPMGRKELPLVPEMSQALQIECSIHPWMNAFIWSFNHPYADITKSPTSPALIKADDPSFGTYEIKNVPTGVKLKIVAWHEGKFLTKPADAEVIEVKEGEPLVKDFEMK